MIRKLNGTIIQVDFLVTGCTKIVSKDRRIVFFIIIISSMMSDERMWKHRLSARTMITKVAHDIFLGGYVLNGRNKIDSDV